MNVADVLSGRAKLKGIRWLLLSASAHKVLADRLRALLPARAAVGPFCLREVRFKPRRRLTAYYDAVVHGEREQAYGVRPIAVTWGSETETSRGGERIDVTEVQADPVRREVAAPFLLLVGDLPERNMHIRVWPLDPRFTQLARLSDPQHVNLMLGTVLSSGDAAGGRFRISDYTVTSIKYRPGRRHVLRYDPRYPAKCPTVFAKPYIVEEGKRACRREDGARAFRVARDVADQLAERGKGVSGLRPLAYVAEDALVLYPQLRGVPLCNHARQLGVDSAGWLRLAGLSLSALHQLPVTLAGRPEPYGLAAEIRSIARKSHHIPALLPELGSAIQALLDRAEELHDRLPQQPPTFTHGDCKTEHIWAAADGLTMMDFDSSRVADPALDLGYFLADWQFQQPAQSQARTGEMCQSLLAGYAAHAPRDFLIRVRLCEAAKLLKCAVRRVQPFEDDWMSRVKQIADRAEALIDDVHRRLGWHARFSLPRSFDPGSAVNRRHLS